MEQQDTKLPLEWLSGRRTPELHRLEQLCRETAREQRCAQRRLQEVEEAMAPETEKSRSAPTPKPETQLEQLSRKLNTANAELRRYETRMFAYERTMVALRKENAELTARCDELHKEVDTLSAALLRLDVPPKTELPPLPVIEFPPDTQDKAAPVAADKTPEAPGESLSAARKTPRTRLEHLSDEVLDKLSRLMPEEK